MTTLSAAQTAGSRKPAWNVVLSPTDFADDWHKRPAADVAVGLRRVCERDIQIAKAEASKFVVGAYRTADGFRDPDVANEAWNDAFMRWAMAAATTDPNDTAIPYFVAAQDTIGFALTPEGIRKLWTAYHVHVRRTDAATRGADDADVARLARILAAGKLAGLADDERAEVRRVLGWCLSRFGADEGAESDDDDGDVYVVTAA